MIYLDKQKAKVLIIATTKFELDGITNVILNYYRSMDKSNIQIDLLTPNLVNKTLKKEIESHGSNVITIKGRTKNPILYVHRLSKIIKRNNYNIVHAHGNSCTLAFEMYAAKKGGAKVRISHSHNTRTKYVFLNKILRKSFESNYTHAFACGQDAGKWLFRNENFEVIKNGIDINKFKFNYNDRKIYRKKLNLEGKKVIGHIGHFSYQKNHDFLIDIFNELVSLDTKYRLLLVGDGPLRSNIEQKVNRLGLSKKVILLGKSNDVPNLMQAMDKIVMPSRFEGLPLTLVEAQTACLPCYVSNTVTEEIALTDLVEFISKDATAREWALKINQVKNISRKNIKSSISEEIIAKGYSIFDNAQRMKELYIQYLRDSN